MTGVQILLACGMLFILILIWLVQRSKHPFDIRDTLMDSKTGKASQYAIILWLMTGMAMWVCIDRSNDGKDVDTLVLGVLSIFVLGRAASSFINRGGAPDDPPPQKREVL